MGDVMFRINKDMKNANVPRTVRFTESLFCELREVAKKNEISFNLLVLECCKYALDNIEDKNNGPNDD